MIRGLAFATINALITRGTRESMDDRDRAGRALWHPAQAADSEYCSSPASDEENAPEYPGPADPAAKTMDDREIRKRNIARAQRPMVQYEWRALGRDRPSGTGRASIPDGRTSTAADGAYELLCAIVRYAIEVLGRVLSLIKTPLALAITVFIILIAAQAVANRATGAICAIPGSRYILSGCVPSAPPTTLNEMQSLIDAHENLDRIQELAAGGLSLPLQIKRGESAIREVSKRVELSDLPSRSVVTLSVYALYRPKIQITLADGPRHALVPLFDDFQKKARTAGTDIRRFFSHMGRTYDMAIGITDMTERRLMEIEALDSAPTLDAPLTSKALALFRAPPPSTYALVRDEYLFHLERLKGTVDTLITENQIVLGTLEDLEETLRVISDHATTDEVTLNDTHRDLQSRFLALFRIHAPELRRLESSLETLNVLKAARDYAASVFSGSLELLHGVSEALDDLRVRIVEREAIVEAKDVASLEYQLTLIRKSLGNMRAGKEKTEKAKSAYFKDLQKQIDDNFQGYGDIVGGYVGKISDALVELTWARGEANGLVGENAPGI